MTHLALFCQKTPVPPAQQVSYFNKVLEQTSLITKSSCDVQLVGVIVLLPMTASSTTWLIPVQEEVSFTSALVTTQPQFFVR